MYQYIWDEETGGPLLITELSKFSKEPRPVYYRELDILGFDKYWNYPKDDRAPLMWAEANNYIYFGRTVARTKGGSLYTAPEIILLEEPEPDGGELRFVNIEKMVAKNADIMETLTQETIQSIYNNYIKHKDKIDIFYVAFSGGKDSVVALDLVQRTLPHDEFIVLFGDTRMEFPDTYEVVEKISKKCESDGIRFYRAKSVVLPHDTWQQFGPPSTSHRWCCSVHKTSPQINFLRRFVDNERFTGLAFTGIRCNESVARHDYDRITNDKKHSGQFSFHVILDWSSVELFVYIYSKNLVLNEAYKKGHVRAGCLVCPNSSGKHEYIKRCTYAKEVDKYLDIISNTSGKTSYSDKEMHDFIDKGFWRTRKSGRELVFGQDKFTLKFDEIPPKIETYVPNIEWVNWGKTIGVVTQISENSYQIPYKGKIYKIEVQVEGKSTTFILKNCNGSKEDIHFQALMRSVIIKSIYCVGCGECEAECKYNCINMKDGIVIGDNCVHCYRCHNVRDHCLRYSSIKNKIKEEKKVETPDRYYTFGTREEWVDTFVKYEGNRDFWLSDGDGKVPNKKKDAFRNFVIDSGLVVYDKKAEGDKYTKCIPTSFAKTIIAEGALSSISWALILVNLVYTPAFNWFVNNIEFDTEYTPDSLKLLLDNVMENDVKGRGKRNVVDSLKIFMAKTPLGKDKIFAESDINIKESSSGNETITLNTISRTSWSTPDPRVILYSLYKFAEKCGEYYQFSLATLLDDTIERDGISPTRIFGLDRDTMVPILNGLSVNYSEFISASFTLGLDTISLRPDKTSEDVLSLF